jgi:class 3 adenylate cyclase/tetratricopeptide (TPR) repeat protein
MPSTDHKVLQRYVPRVASEWGLDAAGARWREVDSSLCFVDLSGFTSLSERLARRGRIGAEELTEVLNRVFGAMLGLAYERGGSLLKFGGDALLLHFTGQGHPEQAACAAVEMRAALRDAASVPTSVGRVTLRMSVGIHSGRVQLFRVGTLHHELIITGEAATTVALMEAAAEAGEILVSAGTAARLPASALGAERAGGRLLRWRRAPVAPCGVRRRRGVSPDDVVSCMPEVLRRTLADGRVEPEHRTGIVGFLRFQGVDRIMREEGTDAVAEALHHLVATVQAAAESEGCTFLASDVDKDGGKIILTTGVPATQDDDDGRMLRTMRHVLDTPSPLVRRAGVNRGHVFAGAVGSEHRATFTVMGDTVNVAARLMAAAGEDEIYASPTVAVRSRSPFVVSPLPPLPVKGKAEPLAAVSVGVYAAEVTGPHGDIAPAAAAFVGRVPEIARIADALERARAGTGAAVTVVGPTGVGKSRLVAEALAPAADVETVWMRGDPTGRATPYRAVRAGVRHLLGLSGDDDRDPDAAGRRLTSTIAAHAPHLVPYAPLLAAVVDAHVPETPETAALERRFRPERATDVLVELLRAGRGTPLVLVADDAQWFDTASASMMARIADGARELDWVVIATRRPATGGFDPVGDVVIELHELSATAAAALVHAEASELRPAEVDAIVRRSGGNPLFLHELLRAARDVGVDELPDTLQEAVSTELDALTPAARRLVRCASVLGNSFPTDVLRRLVIDEQIEIDDATAGALARFLDGDGRDGLRFRHAMMREVVYEGLTYRRRRDLHVRAGQIVEQVAGDDPDAAAETLSMHAALGHDHHRAWRFARVAGDRARDRYANVEAVTHYERALDAGRRLAVAPAELAVVWRQLGDAQEQLGLFAEALESYRRAASLTTEPVVRADLLWRRARVRMHLGEYRSALADASRGRRLLDDDARAEAAVWRSRLIALQAWLRQAQQQAEAARRLAIEAAAAAEAAGDGSALARAQLVLDWANRVLGRSDRTALGERALEIYEELGDLDGVAKASNNLGALAYFEGDWERAAGWYRRSLDAYRRAGNATAAAVTASNLGELLVSRRAFDDAREVLRDAVRVLRAARSVDDLFFADLQTGRLLLEEGHHSEAVEHLGRVRDEAAAVGQTGYAFEAAVLAASALAMDGRHAEALTAVDAAARASGGIDAVYRPLAARVRSIAFAGLGRHDDALAEAATGLDVAREQELLYDEALLLQTIDAITGKPSGATRELFARLGIRVALAPA